MIVEAGRKHLAASIARIAMVNLRMVVEPIEADYVIADQLLGIAREIDPESHDLIRQQMQAAFLSGNESKALDLSSQALRLDPADSVIQLRRITAAIGRNNQTIEDRIKVIDQFLADRRIDDAIKSRLSLDAALLVRERGDERGFLERLSRATSLDSSNKAAAYLAATYVLDRLEDPQARVDARINLLMADPADPQVQMDLARELAFHGAFVSAQRFHNNALAILAASDIAPSVDPTFEREALRWQVEGPGAVVATMDEVLRTLQARQAAAIDDRKRRNIPFDDITPPEDVRLTPELARIGLIAAYAFGDQAAFEGARQRLVGDLVKRLEKLANPLTAEGLDDKQRQEVGLDIAMFLQTTRIAVGLDPDSVQRDIDSSPALAEKFPDRVNQLRTWVKLRKGEQDPKLLEEALAEFAAWPDPNPFMEFGHGNALEKLGRTAEAIQQYRRAASMFPLDIYGAWARTRAVKLGDPKDTELGTAIDRRVARQVPDWVDRMVARPQDFINVTASAVSGGETVVDPIVLRLTVRNLSPIPLSIGPDATISSSFLLAPRAEMRQDGLDGRVVPEVIELDRRLRLMPREELVVDVRPDLAQTGWTLEALCTRSVRMRFRVIQAFQPDMQRGGFRTRALGQIVETGPLTRRPLPEAALGAERFPKAIADAPANTLFRLAASIRGTILLPVFGGPGLVGPGVPADQPGLSAAELGPIAASLVERYPGLEPAHRAHLAALIPPARLAPGLEAFDEAVRADADPVVTAIALVTRVTEPDDAMLKAGLESSDERIRTICTALLPVLQRQDTTYARIDAATLSARVQAATPAPASAAATPAPAAAPSTPPEPAAPATPDVQK